MKNSPIFKRLAEIAFLAAVYFAAGKLGLMLASVHASATAVWPPTGIALAVLLIRGKHLWPGIALGAFLTNVTTEGSLVTCIGIAAGNTLEALAGVYLVNRFAHGRKAFESPNDVVKFFGLAAVVSTTLSPTFGVTSLVFSGYAAWADFGKIWLTWWLGDMSGNILVAPLLVLWGVSGRVQWTWKQSLEMTFLVFLTAGFGLIIFTSFLFPSTTNYALTFLCLPPLLWVALRFGQREAATAIFILAGIAIAGTVRGLGPFVKESANESLLLVQLFLGVNATVTLMVGAVVLERKKTGHALSDSEHRFRSIWENSGDGMRLTDRDGNLVAANKAFCTLIGFSAHEMVGKPFTWSYAEIEKPEELLARYRRRFAERAIRPHLEARLVFRSGRTVDLEITNSFIEPGSQGPLLLGIFRDVTERKRAEARSAALSALGHELSSATGARDAALIIVKIASSLLGWDACFLHLYSGEQNAFTPLLTMDTIDGKRVDISLQGYTSDPSPMMLKVVREGSQLILRDDVAKTTDNLVPIGDVVRRSASLMFVPIHDGHKVMGILSIQSYTPEAYDRADLDILQALADHGASALDRIHAQEALRRAEEKYRTIFENATEGIFQIAPDGRFLNANPALAKMLGYATPEELIKNVEENRRFYVRPGARDELYRRLAEEGSISGAEEQVYRKDGSIIWVNGNGRIVRDPSGRPLYYQGSAQDITERKQAEEKIRLLAHTIESVSEMVTVTDLENRFVYVNRAFLDRFGYSQEEILGQKVNILDSSNNPPGRLQEIVASTRSGQWQGEVIDRTRNGEDFPMWLSTSHVCDEKGRMIALVGISMDITERKRSETRRTAFSRLGHELSVATHAREAARIIVEIASNLIGWDASFLHLYSAEQRTFVPVLTIDTIDGQRVDVSLEGYVLDPSPSMRRVFKEGAQLVLRDDVATVADDLIPIGDVKRRSASLMFAPIHKGRSVVGVLSIQSYAPQAYSQEDLDTLQALADHAAGALERIQVQEALQKAEENYRTIFENATEGIFQSTPEGRYLSVNPALARMLGYDSPEEMIQSVNDIDRPLPIGPGTRDELRRRLLDRGFVRGFEDQIYRKDGSMIWVSINARSVYDDNGRLLYYEGSNQDITERKRAEIRSTAFSRLGHELSAAISQQEAAQIIAEVADQLFGWDACTVDSYDAEEDKVTPILNIDIVNGNRVDVPPRRIGTKPTVRARRIIAHGAELILRETPLRSDEDSVPFGDVSRLSASLMVAPILHGERVLGIISAQSYTSDAYNAEDLSALQALASHCGGALARIQAQETIARFGAIVEFSEDAIVSKTLDGTITSWNRGAEKVFGYAAAEIIGHPVATIIPANRIREDKAIIEWIKDGQSINHFETIRMRKDGELIDISVTISPIRDSLGKIVGASQIARDITERKQAEAKIQSSLEEKEVMLKEIHHRVKNNLQVVSSFLHLQSGNVTDPKVRELLHESENRVKSMALIHENLYQSKNLSKINFDEYVRKLTADLFDSFGANTGLINLRINIPELLLGIDPAIHCGLIINELISNALKHAFPNGRKGEIAIDLLTGPEGQLHLTIRDDGVGFPEGLDFRKTTSLGLQLVVNLSRQLNGSIELLKDRGTEFRLILNPIKTVKTNQQKL